MRIRSKRRRLLLLSKILILFTCLFSFYFFIRSITAKTENHVKIIPIPKIYVVESETDAFDVWENTTNTNDLSHTSGTLIAVNSHCNDGLYMKWKNNITNIINMSDALTKLVAMPLQTIYPAVAGLFRKIMCVYPWWRPTSAIYVHHINYLGVRDESLCLCTSTKNITSFNESSCRILRGGQETFVSAKDCRLLGQHWETFTMQEIYAQTALQDTTSTDKTMLSINLDFFTVDREMSLPGRDVIESIEAHIDAILCPRNIQDETFIDAWFQKLTDESNMSVDDHVTYLDKYHLPLCSNKKTSIKARLKSLLATINRLSKSQRNQLLHAGLCILSPTSYYMHRSTLSLIVCSGQMNMTDSNLAHTAGDFEITLQMEKLTQFLKQSVRAPSLITIVRSTRLGLVSPKSQVILESLLLKHLESIYHSNVTDVIYHPNLLGGVNGWSERQKLSLFYSVD